MNEINGSGSVCAVIMASGRSKRFGSNKLFANVNGIPVIVHAIKTMIEGGFDRVTVVSGDENILKLAGEMGAYPVRNGDTTDDQAVTIRLGIENILPGSLGCALFVADQPLFKCESADGLRRFFMENPDSICAASINGKRGNPVIFPREYFDELHELLPGERGKTVLNRHSERLKLWEVSDEKELWDIDTAEDMQKILKNG